MKLFSQRNAQPADRYSYTIPSPVRARIFQTLQQHNGWMSGAYDFLRLLEEVEQLILARMGRLHEASYTSRGINDVPIVIHFFSCSDEESLDFIQLCFHARTMGGVSENARILVGIINRIFEEEGIGYELTPPAIIDEGPGTLFGRTSSGMRACRVEFPMVIRKDERVVHDKAVKPALEKLRDPRFATANNELLNAFEEIQKGGYADAITSCGSAFESVMKTICDMKRWDYDPNTDTCSKLVEICRARGLFFPLYAPLFTAVGTVRNKLGDAHGKGPAPENVATREHAEHMVAITCAHIDFLLGQAGV
jgi:hypothetical protein